MLRQISTLKSTYALTVIGFGPHEHDEIDYIELTGLSKTQPASLVRYPFWLRLVRAAFAFAGFHKLVCWVLDPAVMQIKKKLRERRFDFVLANDVETIPIAMWAAKGAPVLADLHEYAPALLEKGTSAYVAHQRHRIWLCDNYLDKPVRLFTVAEPIAELYAKRWAIEKPLLLPNAPPYQELSPSATSSKKIQLVYHGLGGSGRGLEVLLRALSNVKEKFELHFYLVGGYDDEIQKTVQSLRIEESVIFHKPVPTEDIAAAINSHDIGVIIHEPVTDNHLYSLPNKFFESIQARLGLLIGPSPSMKPYISHHGFGVVANGFDEVSIASSLEDLTPESVKSLKEASHKAAYQLAWNSVGKVLTDTVGFVVGAERPGSTPTNS